MASEMDEIVLLERVFLCFGNADTDEQLETTLAKFLPPVLLKLSSTQEGVRKKVMELLVHINKRVKTRPQVQLPMDVLLKQYDDPAATAFVVNFTIIYIKIGYPRLSAERQAQLLPQLVSCLRGKPAQHQDSLLHLIVGALVHAKLPAGTDEAQDFLGLRAEPQIQKLLLDFMFLILLLPYGRYPATSGDSEPPGGLSKATFRRATGEPPLTAEQLEAVKTAIVRFISCGVFIPESSYVLHLIVATSDTRHKVASEADHFLRQISGSIDWSDPLLVNAIFSLFIGIPRNSSKANADTSCAPAPTRLRLKLLPWLLRNRKPPTMVQLSHCFIIATELMVDSSDAAPSVSASGTATPVMPGAAAETTANAESSAAGSAPSIQTPKKPDEGAGKTSSIKLRSQVILLVHNFFDNFDKDVLGLTDQTAFFHCMMLGVAMMEVGKRMSEDSRVRALALTAIGKMGRALPSIFSTELSYVTTLFGLTEDPVSEVRMAAQEALSMLAPAFATKPGEKCPVSLEKLEELVLSKMRANEHTTRQMALKYIAEVFQPNHVTTRVALLLATCDPKEDLRREASRILFSHPELTPDFLEMLFALQTHNAFPIQWAKNIIAAPQHPVVVRFLRECLCNNAGKPRDSDESSPYIAKYFDSLKSVSKATGLLQFYVQLCHAFSNVYADASVLFALLECVATSAILRAFLQQSNNIGGSVGVCAQFLKMATTTTKDDVRENSAQIFAHLAEFSDLNGLMQTISDPKSAPEAVCGSVVALGYAVSGFVFRSRRDSAGNLFSVGNDHIMPLVSILKEKDDAHVLVCGCIAVGEIARVSPLPVQDPAEVRLALKRVLDNNKLQVKQREKAAIALGFLCVGDPNYQNVKDVLEHLIQTEFKLEDMEVHFSVGEALCNAILGPASPSARDHWLELETSRDQQPTNELLKLCDWLLTEVLSKYVRHTKPALRQAGCVWLLEILKRCGKLEPVVINLRSIQNSLLNLLADRSDAVQSMASKGLSLLYELSPDEDRKALVGNLLEALTTGRRTEVTVTGETQLFDEGTLGSAPTGGNLTTYKELCSLATDLNQPDLVYKFMHLANHHAMWNSKKGAAFGFGSIADKAGEQLAEKLGDIVPKLYRYRFDPNAGTRASFNSIWTAIVKEPQKTVDRYEGAILADLVKHSMSNEWRVRESSCLALADLLATRNIYQLRHQLPELWETLFRVRDDIKESVRNAADVALKTLSRCCIRGCDSASTNKEHGEAVLGCVLPSLINVGLTNRAKEVRELSIATVTQLSRSAGPLLKPYITTLFGALLESLSELEPQVLAYLSVRSGDNREQVDAARISVSKSSPMMDTINHCVLYVDTSVLETLVPRMCELIRSSIGLGTKAGCAHLAVQLAHHCASDLQPFAGKLLGALVNGLSDPSLTLRKTYAQSIGHVTKVAKPSSVERLVERLRTWYLEKDDEATRNACAMAFQAMARHCSDTIKEHTSSVLPLAFYAKHAAVKPPLGVSSVAPSNGESNNGNDVSSIGGDMTKVWEDVWEEFVSSNEVGCKLYQDEISELVLTGLDNGAWPLKRQAAESLTTMAKVTKEDLKRANEITEKLLSVLPGRVWEGKESLVAALATVAVHSIAADQVETIKKIVDALNKECSRGELGYRLANISALADVLEIKYQSGSYALLLQTVEPMLKTVKVASATTPKSGNGSEVLEKGDSDDDDDDGNGGAGRRMQADATQAILLGALARAYPKTSITEQNECIEPLCRLIVSRYSLSTWKVQSAFLKTLTAVFTVQKEVPTQCCEDVIGACCRGLLVNKYRSLQLEALSLAKVLADKFKVPGIASTEGRLKLRATLDQLASEAPPEIRHQAEQVLSAFTSSG